MLSSVHATNANPHINDPQTVRDENPTDSFEKAKVTDQSNPDGTSQRTKGPDHHAIYQEAKQSQTSLPQASKEEASATGPSTSSRRPKLTRQMAIDDPESKILFLQESIGV